MGSILLFIAGETGMGQLDSWFPGPLIPLTTFKQVLFYLFYFYHEKRNKDKIHVCE